MFLLLLHWLLLVIHSWSTIGKILGCLADKRRVESRVEGYLYSEIHAQGQFDVPYNNNNITGYKKRRAYQNICGLTAFSLNVAISTSISYSISVLQTSIACSACNGSFPSNYLCLAMCAFATTTQIIISYSVYGLGI